MTDGLKSDGGPAHGQGSDGNVTSEIQEKLGERLKDAYAHVINEPVPDRFVALLDQLAASGTPSGSAGTDDPTDDG